MRLGIPALLLHILQPIGYLLVLCQLSYAPNVWAQSHPLKFRHLTINDGLSQSTVQAILQDQRGFMWFGTADGLNRYNGYDFHVYRYSSEDSTSLPHNDVTALLEDQDGYIWVGTDGGGLARFDFTTERFKRYSHESGLTTLPSWSISTLYLDTNRHLWIGMKEGHVGVLNPETDEFTRVPLEPHRQEISSEAEVRAIYEPPSTPGVLWIGTRTRGLFQLDTRTGELLSYPHITDSAEGINSPWIETIFEDHTGRLWIGVMEVDLRGGGVHRLDRQTKQFYRYMHDPEDAYSLSQNDVKHIAEDTGGILWISTRGGLNRFDPATERFERYQHAAAEPTSLASDIIWDFYVDSQDNFWIGFREDGIDYLNTRQVHFAHVKGPPTGILPTRSVNTIFEDSNGTVWIGSYEGGLSQIDLQRKAIQTYRNDVQSPSSLSHDIVLSLHEDQNANLWIGTYNGLNLLRREAHQSDSPTFRSFVLFPEGSPLSNAVIALTQDQSGLIWVGTAGGGLVSIDPITAAIDYYENTALDTFRSFGITSILEEGTKLFWIGTTNNGLYQWNAETDSLRSFRHIPKDTTSLSHDGINTLFRDQSGSLWVGTDNGLNRWDVDREVFIRYTEADGLPNPWVGGILGDRLGNLWMSTNKGIARLDPQSERFITFNARDQVNLQSNEFNARAYHKGISGKLYFGGINGLNIIDPRQVFFDQSPPRVVLESLKLHNEHILLGPNSVLKQHLSVTKQLNLEYWQNDFSVTFAGLHYSLPEKNTYAYKLDQYDDEWRYVGDQRTATYTNLNPGFYTLRVKAANSSGVWNETGTSLYLLIRKPWWETWWFYTLVVLGIIGIMTIAYQYRIQQIHKLKRTRQRIANDLHDDIGSKISSVALRMDIAGRNEELATPVRDQFTTFSHTVRDVVNDLRDSVWIVDSEHDNLSDLVVRMEQTAEQILVDRSYEFTCTGEIPKLAISMERRRHLFLFYKEALHNALRHSQAGRISIRIAYTNSLCSLHISDDGIGFDPEQVRRGHGLKTMYHRAAQLNGALHLNSKPGAGTEILLEVDIA